MLRRLLILVAALALVGCRVDVTVDVTMEQNGSGEVTVTVVADADVVEQAPGLADDLRFDDLRAAGWTVEGPKLRSDCSLRVALAHGFYTPEQATALLASLNGTQGPLKAVAFSRTASTAAIRYTISGAARVAGLDAFADADLTAAVGATPWADAVAANGLDADAAVDLVFTATLPGEVASTTAADTEQPLAWDIPIDDNTVDLATTTIESLERGGIWGALPTIAATALAAWVAAAVVVIALVAGARRRRKRRALRRMTPPA